MTYEWVRSKLVLHKHSFPNTKEYSATDEIFRVEIVETKPVPNLYHQTKKNLGLRAVDSEGRNYYNNWERYDDSSMDPRSLWVGRDTMWYDITRTSTFLYIPFRPIFMDKFKDILGYCELHGKLGYLNSNPENLPNVSPGPNKDFCFSCFIGKPPHDPYENTWLGWK